MKLIFVTQVLDPNHGSLAQTLDLVAALAAETDELVVLCREDRWGSAPPGVQVRKYGARSKAGRAFAYQRQLAASIDGADAILAHMVPTFLVLAAPLAKVRRVPLLRAQPPGRGRGGCAPGRRRARRGRRAGGGSRRRRR